MLKITEVRIFPRMEEKLKAYASMTFEDCFVVHNVRIVAGEKGLMVCMPSRKRTDGVFKDVAHPISAEFRAEVEKLVLEAYQKQINNSSQK